MSDYAALQEEMYYAYQYIAQIEGMVTGSLPDRPPQIKPRPGPPVNVDVPSISGTGEVGEVLTCTMGNWSGMGESTNYAYDWDALGAETSGSTYTVDTLDAGASISCVVTATNSYGATEAPPSNAITIAGAAADAASRSTRRGR